jgi:large subunit ribosomal protein L29
MSGHVKIEEIRGKDTRQLRLDLQELRKEQFDMRFRGAAEEVAKTSRFRQIRRTVARIMTVMGERERADQAKAGGKP